MAAARFYSSVVGALDLTGSISNSATSMTVSSTSGLPGTTPFTLVLDPGTATEEIVDVTNVSGLTLTITRGVDGTAAQAHSAGVGNVRHMATARDFREPQEHIGYSADVHGVGSTSSVVGTETVQTLKNKTAAAATAGTAGFIVKGAASQTANILDVQNSSGSSMVSVKPAEGSLTVGTSQAKINGDGASNLFGYIAKFTSDAAGSVVAILKAAASATADILQIQNSSGTVVAKFDKDGKLTAPQVTSTGDVSGTTGTFSGALSSPTITSLQNADTTASGQISGIDTRVTALETSAWTNASLAGGVTGTLKYRQRGQSVDVVIDVAGSFPAGFTTISAAGALPAATRPTATPARAVAYVGSGTTPGAIEVTSAGTINVQVQAGTATVAKVQFTYPAN